MMKKPLKSNESDQHQSMDDSSDQAPITSRTVAIKTTLHYLDQLMMQLWQQHDKVQSTAAAIESLFDEATEQLAELTQSQKLFLDKTPRQDNIISLLITLQDQYQLPELEPLYDKAISLESDTLMLKINQVIEDSNNQSNQPDDIHQQLLSALKTINQDIEFLADQETHYENQLYLNEDKGTLTTGQEDDLYALLTWHANQEKTPLEVILEESKERVRLVRAKEGTYGKNDFQESLANAESICDILWEQHDSVKLLANMINIFHQESIPVMARLADEKAIRLSSTPSVETAASVILDLWDKHHLAELKPLVDRANTLIEDTQQLMATGLITATDDLPAAFSNINNTAQQMNMTLLDFHTRIDDHEQAAKTAPQNPSIDVDSIIKFEEHLQAQCQHQIAIINTNITHLPSGLLQENISTTEPSSSRVESPLEQLSPAPVLTEQVLLQFPRSLLRVFSEAVDQELVSARDALENIKDRRQAQGDSVQLTQLASEFSKKAAQLDQQSNSIMMARSRHYNVKSNERIEYNPRILTQVVSEEKLMDAITNYCTRRHISSNENTIASTAARDQFVSQMRQAANDAFSSLKATTIDLNEKNIDTEAISEKAMIATENEAHELHIRALTTGEAKTDEYLKATQTDLFDIMNYLDRFLENSPDLSAPIQQQAAATTIIIKVKIEALQKSKSLLARLENSSNPEQLHMKKSTFGSTGMILEKLESSVEKNSSPGTNRLPLFQKPLAKLREALTPKSRRKLKLDQTKEETSQAPEKKNNQVKKDTVDNNGLTKKLDYENENDLSSQTSSKQKK